MRLFFTTIITILLISISDYCNAAKINITLEDYSENKVLIVKYYGSTYRILDSARLDKAGKLSLDKIIKEKGIYGIILYDTKILTLLQDPMSVSYSYLFNFIFDKNDISLSCDIHDPVRSMNVLKSDINKEYYALLKNQQQILAAYRGYKFPMANQESQLQILKDFGNISNEVNDITPTFPITKFSNNFSPYYQEGINYYYQLPEEKDIFLHDEITLSSSAYQYALWNIMRKKSQYDTVVSFLKSLKYFYTDYPRELDLISRYIYQDIFYRDTFKNDKLMTWTWNNFYKDNAYSWQTPLDRTFLNEFGSKIGGLPIGDAFPLKDFKDSSGNIMNFSDFKDAEFFVIHFIDGNIQNDLYRLSKQHKAYVKYNMDTMHVVYLMVCINESGRRFFDAEMLQRKYKGFEGIYLYADDKNWNNSYYWNIKFGNVFIVNKEGVLLSKGYSNLTDEIYKQYFMK